MSARIPPSMDEADTALPLDAKPLVVDSAAVRIGEAVLTLPRPNRHHNLLWWLHVLGVPSRHIHDQGFVLSDGTYADRARAYAVAASAGQLTSTKTPGTLFSEDLWDGGADMPLVSQIRALAHGPHPPPGQPQ